VSSDTVAKVPSSNPQQQALSEASAEAVWLRPSKADPAVFTAFLEQARRQPLRAFEVIDPVRRQSPDRFERAVERNLGGPWHVEGGQLPGIAPPIDWSYLGRANQIRLQCFAPASILLAAHSISGRPEYLDLAQRYAEDWLKTFQQPAFAVKPENRIAPGHGEPAVAWTNMALGLRAQRLAYLFDAACHSPHTPATTLKLYFDSIHYHVEILNLPGVIGMYGNHGMLQALGLIAICRRFAWYEPFAGFASAAAKTLTLSLNMQFTPDGAHMEHSPGYHVSALNSLTGARDSGLTDGIAPVAQLIDLAEEATAAMLLPDGRLASFGDTDFLPLTAYGPGDRYRNRELIYMLSQGKSGVAPVSGVRIYPDAGYAFARIHDNNPAQASYLAQMGSFHSRAHKQADHLCFIWAEGPMAILGDPGRYALRGATAAGSELHKQGFFYGDPKRIYVESTHAHNCVEVDGESHSRDISFPFGSAFQQADIQDSLVVFDFEMRHPKAVRQIRTLILSPNQFLLVIDWLRSEISGVHDFRQWFKMVPEWTDAVVEGNAVAATRDVRTVWAMDLLGAPVSQVWRGATDPLRGWFSSKGGEMQPASSFNFSRLRTTEAAFATLFLLDGWIEPDPATRIESFGEAATFAFTTVGQSVEIEYRRENGVLVKRIAR
jgi:hypothetical protein